MVVVAVSVRIGHTFREDDHRLSGSVMFATDVE